MKKFFKLYFVFFLVLLLSGCNSREDVDHLSKENLISYVESKIDEKVEFISLDDSDLDRYIYTFRLVDRNIEFDIFDVIFNDGFCIDGSCFYDNYKQRVNFKDYIISVVSEMEDERIEILNRYGYSEQFYENIGSHTITIEDYTDLSNLCKYIIDLDNLYQFKISDVDEEELHEFYLTDVISFSEVDIDGVSYSTSEDLRLEYNQIYEELERQYIKRLKEFDLYDDTIPNDIWNKY